MAEHEPGGDRGLETLLAWGYDEPPIDLALAAGRLRQVLFDADPEPVTMGRYRVLDRLGAGGMGTVYAAEDPALHRRLALKVLRADGAGVDVERARRLVLREARAAARLQHPNVVTVFEVGAEGDEVYLAMELVQGETLRSWAAGEARAADEILAIYLQAARGIAAAHAAGLVHGDFKPDNALLGEDGRVRVADFGLARGGANGGDERLPGAALEGADDGGTAATTIFGTRHGGTPAYMAPEQHDGPATAASDQYAFCVSLHEALHGALPEPGRNAPPRGSRLDRVLRQGLAADPGARHESMEALIAALEGARTETARGPRRRILRGAAGAAGGLLLVALAVVGWMRFVAPLELFQPPPRPTRITPTGFDGAAVRSLDVAPDGTWLVHSDGTDLYRSELDRPGARRLTGDFEPAAVQPAISPDGEDVAFSAGGALYLLDLDGGAPPRRVADQGFDPRWSPDGATLAYTTESYPEIKARLTLAGELGLLDLASGQVTHPIGVRDELWVYSPDADATRTVEERDEVHHIAWSPDGERLALSGWQGLWTVRRDGTDVDFIADDGWSQQWTPDGAGIIYLAFDEEGAGIFHQRVDRERGHTQGAPRKIAELPAEGSFPADLRLLPGDRLLVRREQFPATMLRVPFDPDSGTAGEPTPVFDAPNTFTTPAVSPDGEWLAFVSYESHEDLYVSRLDGTEISRLSTGEIHTRNPTFSPDGARIYFEGIREGWWASMWSVDRTGGDLINESGWSPAPLVIPRFSPDGRQLSMTALSYWPFAVDPTRPWVPQAMEQTNLGLQQWVITSWSPDGRSFAAVRARHGVARLDVETRERLQLLDRGDFALWLPDGLRLLVADGSQVLRLDAESGETEVVLDVAPRELAMGASLALTPDSRTLIVATQQPGGSLEIVEFLDGD